MLRATLGGLLRSSSFRYGKNSCPSNIRFLCSSSNDKTIITESAVEVFGESPGDIHVLSPDEYRPHIQEMADKILKLDQLEMRLFHLCLMKKLGVEYDAGAVDSSASSDNAGQAVAEEKTSFELKLESFDASQKIKVIKEVRAITGLGLKEAKEMVESVPCVMKSDIKKEDGEALIAKLKEVGAVGQLE